MKNTVPISQQTDFYSGFPVSLYLLLVMIAAYIIAAVQGGYAPLPAILYAIIISGFYYWFFSRWGCSVSVSEGRLVLNYLFKREIILFQDLRVIDYKKGYYDIGTDKPHTFRDFPMYCYDSVILQVTDDKGDISRKAIHINTMMFGFGKLLKYINGRH